jgi:hypothetical protein
VIEQSKLTFGRIIDNFPLDMKFIDESGGLTIAPAEEQIGSIVLAGGEPLIEEVRHELTYPIIETIVRKYANEGGVRVIVQTTGDQLSRSVLRELEALGAWMVSVTSMDRFHAGLESEEKRSVRIAELTAIFANAGWTPAGRPGSGPFYSSFFGATPESGIGELWPRGRAWANELSTATIEKNFCLEWVGGAGFLRHRHAGSKVAVVPTGDVYPCCVRTALPLGNLVDEPLIDILESLSSEPAFMAISAGKPTHMGLAYGWPEQMFIEHCATTTPLGKTYSNFCIGCDRLHKEVLSTVIECARVRRAMRRNNGIVSCSERTF